MSDLGYREWALDGYVFGGTTTMKVLDFELGDASLTTNDLQLPLEDGSVFGRDTKGGFPITLDLMVDERTQAAARTTWRALASRWSNDTNRRSPGAVSVLSMNLNGDTVRVYGRPRKFAAGDTGFLPGGGLPVTADFQTVDHKFYSEDENSLTLTLLNAESVQQGTLNSNSDFEAGVTGWTATGCNLSQAASGTGHSGTYAATLTPDGTTAQVYVASDPFDASQDVRYHAGVWVKRSSGPTLSMTTSITFYDVDNNSLGTSASNATDAASGSWTKVVGTFLAPAGTVSATMQVGYNDSTPASGDTVLIDDASTVELTGFGAPLRVPLKVSGSGKRAQAVTNAGDMETWPVFIFEGPITNPSVAYIGTDKKLTLTMAIPAGHSVTIDTAPWKRTALKDGIGSVAGKLGGTRMAEMALRPGTTIVGFRGQDPTGTSRCRIFWRSASSTP